MQLLYKAKGTILGQYFPSMKFRRGIMVMDDGDKFPCTINKGKVLRQLKSTPELLESQQIWSCYPRLIDDEPGLEFDLVNLITKQEKIEQVKGNVDYFTIAGEVANIDSGMVSVIVRRNIAPPPGKEHWWQWQPHTFVLKGNLPASSAIGKFWEFNCVRTGNIFTIENVILQGEPPQQYQFSSFDEFHHADVMVKPEIQASTRSYSQTPITQKSSTIDDMAITGKLEIVIKINTFPDEVKTNQNGWRSFVVDCEGQIASVTVKPKVFKKLEDAQANYPMWVATITGKLGARTARGFVLDSPAIATFERKPKEANKEANTEQSGAVV